MVPNLTVGLNIDPLSSSLVAKFNEALRYRFSYTFYPESLFIHDRSPQDFISWYDRLRAQEEAYQKNDFMLLSGLSHERHTAIVIEQKKWSAPIPPSLIWHQNPDYIVAKPALRKDNAEQEPES
ncbi:MAG TPA: hypothetical protein DCY48_03355 [Candidatus Magasanikbacteria bacterium]|nr:MAG: hypothetical protein A3I74_04205 [Candidatus Magasanikbacteria bacterium RIFCSPLOWO2_02_FULL_47_16]OGH79361.1 MAG: hypothetical protein A3C10_04745 [Candidatus Magasanikbacteria bacterium RIFCSPHIGHO2_02_FULL_48_18]HAZ28781.1 hypothetical protein [Candidatus Magasanikbacteria bacterium]